MRSNTFGVRHSGVRNPGVRNPAVRQIINIQKNKGPNKNKFFIVEGVWAHKRLSQINFIPETFFYCPELIFKPETKKMYNKFLYISKNTIRLTEKAFYRIASRKNPDGLLSLCRFPDYNHSHIHLKKTNLVLILDGLEKPGNIGTLIRTLDGVGGSGVFICNRRVRITHPKIVKSSCGIMFTIPIIECRIEDISRWISQNKFTIYLATCSQNNSIHNILYSKRTVIVLGNERYGISREWYNMKHKEITIPMKGHIDSYNVAVAGSIIMYEAAKSIFSHE